MNDNSIDRIVSYIVRIPGRSAWSEHKSIAAARRERKVADRICQPGHQVYARHASGITVHCER